MRRSRLSLLSSMQSTRAAGAGFGRRCRCATACGASSTIAAAKSLTSSAVEGSVLGLVRQQRQRILLRDLPFVVDLVEAVGDADHLRLQRDGVALQTVGEAEAVDNARGASARSARMRETSSSARGSTPPCACARRCAPAPRPSATRSGPAGCRGCRSCRDRGAGPP